MAKYVSLKDYHHFFLEKDKCEGGYIDKILDDVILNNVLFLSDDELCKVLNKLEQYLIKIEEEYQGKDRAEKIFSHPDIDVIKNICVEIRGMTFDEYDHEIIGVSKKKPLSTSEVTPPILRHKLRISDKNSKHFVREVREFLRKFGLIPPQKPLAKEEFQFTIYDNMGNEYRARLDDKDRIFCSEWHKHFKKLNIGDDIIVKVERNLIIIYPEEWYESL